MSSSKKLTERTFTNRASLALHALLTNLGYSPDLMGRVNTLASAANVSKRHATNLLSGLVTWSFDDLALMCNIYGKSAGFFLDPGLERQLPCDTRLVTSSDGGESIVWRVPNGFLNTPLKHPEAPLRYISDSCPNIFANREARMMIVYEDWEAIPAAGGVSVNESYIVEDEDGALQTMLCTDIRKNTMAVFVARDKTRKTQVLIPLRWDSPESAGYRLIGKMVGCIQGV